MYEKARSCFWIEKELDLSRDKYDWDNKLNEDIKKTILYSKLQNTSNNNNYKNDNISHNLFDNFEAKVDIKEGLEKTIAWTMDNSNLIRSNILKHKFYVPQVKCYEQSTHTLDSLESEKVY